MSGVSQKVRAGGEALAEAAAPDSFGDRLWEAMGRRLQAKKYSAGQLELTEQFYRQELPEVLLPCADLPATPENFCASFSAFVMYLADSGYLDRLAAANDRAGAGECVTLLRNQARAMGETLTLAGEGQEGLAQGAHYDPTVFDMAVATRVNLYKHLFATSVSTVGDAWLWDKPPVISPDV